MNIKYLAALSALVMLATPSCWGAAKNESRVSDLITTLMAAYYPRLAALLQQMESAGQHGDTAQAEQFALAAITAEELEQLPAEIIEQIAKFLSPSSLMSLAQVNKRFNTIVMENPSLKSSIQLLKQNVLQLIKKNHGDLRAALLDAINHPNDPMAYDTIDYLARRVNLNMKGDSGETPLMQTNSPTVAKLLIEAGANIDATDSRNMTALMMAAHDNKAEKVKILLEYGANANLESKWGATALEIAIASHAKKVIPILLSWIANGTDIDRPVADGDTALMHAARRGYNDVVTKLIEAGANVNATNDRGGTALIIAAISNQAEIAKTLLDHGAHANLTDNWGNTALDIAIKYKANNVIPILQNWLARGGK